MITAFYEGGDLFKKILVSHTFPESIAAKIMKQVLSAVAYCHSKNIVHRDIKPENIVLEGNDILSNIKLIDFGASKILNPKENLKTIVGTVKI